MHSRSCALIAAPLLVLALGGAADADGKFDLEEFSRHNTAALEKGEFESNLFFNPPDLCPKAVAAGTAAGLGPTDTFTDGAGNTVLWKRAPDVCAQYAKLHPISQAFAAVKSHLTLIPTLRSMSGTDGKPDPSMSADAWRGNVESSKACVKTIGDALAKGVAADVTVAYRDNGGEHRITLPEMRQICADFAVWASDAAAADDKRAEEHLAELRARYAKFGITGDRLSYLVKNAQRPVLGKGCGELAGKALKTAPAFYDLLQDDLAWIVYKTQFKGDKQVSYTSSRYRKDGNWRCK